MSPITVIEDESVSLWYHPESKIVHHKIKQYLAPGVLQTILKRGTELLEKHGAQKWLSDDRDTLALSPDDFRLVREVLNPRAIQAGLRFWAVVTPEKRVPERQVQTLEDRRRDQGVTVGRFDTVEEAMAWLESVR